MNMKERLKGNCRSLKANDNRIYPIIWTMGSKLMIQLNRLIQHLSHYLIVLTQKVNLYWIKLLGKKKEELHQWQTLKEKKKEVDGTNSRDCLHLIQ